MTATIPGTADASGQDHPAEGQPQPPAAAQACKRPGCARPVPASAGRGRSRVFCSDECARRYHNDARLPAPGAGPDNGDADPLAALEQLLRQAGACARAAREQAAALQPARVRADIAGAEAARRLAEAAAATAAALQAEAEAETRALAEALDAARADQDSARALAAELDQLRAETTRLTAAAQAATAQADAAGQETGRLQAERDAAITAARSDTAAAAAETARARQAEADARAEASRVRDDAARERDALTASHAAQIQAQQTLTGAERDRAERAEAQLETERTDRRQLTSHLAASASAKAARARVRQEVSADASA